MTGEPLAGEATIDAEVYRDFGGELRRFRLTVPYLAKVERDCEAGPAVIAGALARTVQLLAERAKHSAIALFAAGFGEWKVAWIRQTIFWGLVGGGMTPVEAGRLVKDFIDERGFMGLLENAEIAFWVITGASVGPEDDPVGESAGGGKSAPEETLPPLPNGRTRYSLIYQMAGAMGWSAGDVAASSLWQLIAAHDGWRKANCPDSDGLTDAEFAMLGDLVDPAMAS